MPVAADLLAVNMILVVTWFLFTKITPLLVPLLLLPHLVPLPERPSAPRPPQLEVQTGTRYAVIPANAARMITTMFIDAYRNTFPLPVSRFNQNIFPERHTNMSL